jgi:hypothetical protein
MVVVRDLLELRVRDDRHLIGLVDLIPHRSTIVVVASLRRRSQRARARCSPALSEAVTGPPGSSS